MWNLEEAVSYYRSQGAPGDQSALIGLLKEMQQEHGGSIPAHEVSAVAQTLGVKDSFLLAVIRRIPSLRLADGHLLELCAGPNCGKHTALAEIAESLCGSGKIRVKYVPCMRMCGKGPNIRFDGKLYHQADAELLKRLLDSL